MQTVICVENNISACCRQARHRHLCRGGQGCCGAGRGRGAGVPRPGRAQRHLRLVPGGQTAAGLRQVRRHGGGGGPRHLAVRAAGGRGGDVGLRPLRLRGEQRVGPQPAHRAAGRHLQAGPAHRAAGAALPSAT